MLDRQEERVQQPFPEDALAEVSTVQERIAAVLLERFEVGGITINSPLTEACDTAFWLERTPQGGYTLLLSIVDVATFITTNTTPALDSEARRRAFAHHTPEKVFAPLLPDSLAEGSLSLLGQHCPTLTLTLPIDSSYHVGELSLQQTIVRSRKRFTYEEADQEMAGDTQTAYTSMLQDAYRVALRLWRLRILQGAITTYDLENGWVMTEDGVRILLDADKRYKAYIIEQEFLILANQFLASFLAAAELPALYRNHAVEIPPTKATYGPSISGHGGLNVPVYIRALFPLRSYPDLVNQRILLAHLQREPSLYTVEELEALAIPLNAKEASIKAAKKGHFRSEHDENLQNRREEGPLPDLDQKHFHSVIRRAVEEQGLTPEITQEILRRLAQGDLKDNDLYTLVFRFANNTEEWQPIKEAIFQFLQRSPSYAAMLLNSGQQQGKWNVRYEELSILPVYFQAQAFLTYEGQTYTSSLHTAGRRDRAKQLAIVDVLSKIAGVVLPSPEVPASESWEEDA